MKLSSAGLKLLQNFESLRLSAYPDPGSADGTPWTIGWGATTYRDGRPVRKGDTITRAQADDLLRFHVEKAETQVLALAAIPLTQNQFDALVSFEYNTGALARSTLLKKLNAGDIASAATEFDRWVYNDGKVLQGLVKRRRAEKNLFISTGAAPEAEVKSVGPFTIPAITALVQLLPTLQKLFKGEEPSRVAERNVAAFEAVADKVLPLIINAAGAPNAQAAVEAIKADPVLARAVDDEVKLSYAELQELVEKSVKAARDFNLEIARAGLKVWELPAFWVTAALLIPVYIVVFRVMFGDFSENLQLQVITAVLAIIVLVGGFWLGSSRDSQRKTEIMAGEK
jgi:lysozyme